VNTKQALFVASLFLMNASVSFAGDSSWSEAFSDSDAAPAGQGVLGGAEMVGGAALVAGSPAEIQIAKESAEAEHRFARRMAAEELVKENPEFYAIKEKKRSLEIINGMDPITKKAYGQKRLRLVAELGAATPLVKQYEAALEKRTAEMMATVFTTQSFGRPLTANQLIAQESKLSKLKAGATFATGLALIADGGMRLGLALKHKNPGVSPAITTVMGPVKAPAASTPDTEKQGADTFMAVE